MQEESFRRDHDFLHVAAVSVFLIICFSPGSAKERLPQSVYEALVQCSGATDLDRRDLARTVSGTGIMLAAGRPTDVAAQPTYETRCLHFRLGKPLSIARWSPAFGRSGLN